MKAMRKLFVLALTLFVAALLLAAASSYSTAASCMPTEPDALGPYYKPGAPERQSVGKGYQLTGTVKSSADCSPLGGARIEFWMTGPDGNYDDDHRATVYTDSRGTYRFESNVPKPYFWRKPHIHILVTAEGFRKLITQHYPEQGKSEGIFDLVLVPGNE